MSFVRVGRPQQHSKAKRSVRPNKASAPRREWVSTVNDLSVHKLTPAELNHRHEIHKSHNKAAAQWEMREKVLKRRFRHAGSPAPLDQSSLRIIKEVFSDQLLLQDVLARSDRAMAVVKDLFGDAPRRQTGHPSVTMAPNCHSDSELPVLQRPDPPTQLSLLSQSMMDQQALNELEASGEDHSEEDSYSCGSSENHVIRRANIRKMKARSGARVIQQQKVDRPNYHQAERDNIPVTPCTSGRAPDQTALNASVAVQRVRSKQNQSGETIEEPSVSHVLNPDQSGMFSSRTGRTKKCVSQGSVFNGSSVASLSGDQSTLGLLQTMLGQVEADLDSLSSDTMPGSTLRPEHQRTQGLTGFSVALVSTLGRLVHLLKQRDEEAQKDAQERRKLQAELKEQRGLINALTAETMTLREEATTLQEVLQQQTAELEQKLDTVVLVMGGLGLLEEHTDPSQDSNVKAAVCQSAPASEQKQASVSPAVLLSPPRQTDNWQHIPDNLHPFEDLTASASSLTSSPLTSLPSTSLTADLLRSQCPPETMLAEIAQLSQQNNLIRAQLNQAMGLASGAGGSTSGSSEERRLSSYSTGRITPQSVGEKRTPGSSSTGRQSQNIQAADRNQVTPKATSSNALSVSSMEQRLLELNRQSAAARGRLLELIEQQKQSVSIEVSPSVSSIAPSAFSPHTADRGGSPEVSMLLPVQDHQRQCARSEVSSPRFGGEARDGRTQQMDKQRDGWFSLSAHMR
ncbi:spindle and centriole-associated protein 1 isoform X2 [Mastacembelus armatus]|uniref:spindle and centriole-associated protein 1 isoform X2 n=1 Tax=Mastacembelus armatus TaxID=205130 RepID=UPI000E45BB14|nr:spindle and centriole-associated protein 1 isoform X2 [Mastacembelus armatus]